MRISLVSVAVAVITSFLVLSCTANAPNDGGVCQKSCGSRVIGGGKIRALPLSNKITFKNCTAASTLPEQSFKFLVYEENSVSAGSSSAGNDDAAKDPATQLIPTRIPKAGIAFTPFAPGFIDLSSEPAEWCTDSCGIAEVKFTPKCFEQDVQVGILVPGMLFDDGNNTVPATQFVVEME
jgi:hypothetical protein